MSEMSEAMQDVNRALGELGKNAPAAMKSFSQFADTVLKPGKLDLKTKKLIAIGTELTARCRSERGRDLGGGPALTYVTELHKALEAAILILGLLSG